MSYTRAPGTQRWRWNTLRHLIGHTRGTPLWLSGSPYTDYAEVPDPSDGEVFLYVTSGDLFRFDGISWQYVGVLGQSIP